MTMPDLALVSGCHWSEINAKEAMHTDWLVGGDKDDSTLRKKTVKSSPVRNCENVACEDHDSF